MESETSQLMAKTEKNTQAIGDLAVNMATLTEIVRNSERRHDETIDAMKEASIGIQKLNERISTITAIEKDIATIKEGQSELKAEVRVKHHDLKNVQDLQTTIAAQWTEFLKTYHSDKLETNKEIAILTTAVTDLNAWKNQVIGGTVATKNFISAFPAIMFVLGVVAVFVYQYVINKVGG